MGDKISCFANPKKKVVCFIGDGSLMEEILCKEEYSLKDAVYETYMSINKNRFGERS